MLCIEGNNNNNKENKKEEEIILEMQCIAQERFCSNITFANDINKIFKNIIKNNQIQKISINDKYSINQIKDLNIYVLDKIIDIFNHTTSKNK